MKQANNLRIVTLKKAFTEIILFIWGIEKISKPFWGRGVFGGVLINGLFQKYIVCLHKTGIFDLYLLIYRRTVPIEVRQVLLDWLSDHSRIWMIRFVCSWGILFISYMYILIKIILQIGGFFEAARYRRNTTSGCGGRPRGCGQRDLTTRARNSQTQKKQTMRLYR